MINTKDILETINMISEENLDIRTVTMGISLLDCSSDDPKIFCDRIYDSTKMLESVTAEAHTIGDMHARAVFYRDRVVTALQSVRKAVDLAETKMPADYWPMPTYTELLFHI